MPVFPASRYLSARHCPDDQLTVTDRAAPSTWIEAAYTNTTQVKYTRRSGGLVILLLIHFIQLKIYQNDTYIETLIDKY